MPKRTDTSITITLNHVELVKWHELAKRQSVTLEQLAKEAVELAWLRRSTR